MQFVDFPYIVFGALQPSRWRVASFCCGAKLANAQVVAFTRGGTMRTLVTTPVIAVVLAAASSASFSDTANINFESFGIGAVPGGADGRSAGNHSQFWLPDNAATSGDVRAGIGRSGSQGLAVGNRGNGNDGVIDNLKTGRLADAAGESSVASFNAFESSYWFRTAGNGAPASGNFRFRSESYGTDRTTFLGFQNAGTDLVAIAFDIDAAGNFVQHNVAAGLNWGSWYRVVTEIVFTDGADNDLVNHRIFDESGSLVGSALGIGTWEQGQRLYGYNGGNQVGVDAVQFHARGSVAGDAAYVDDVSWRSYNVGNTVPEPSALALVGLALAAAGMAGRRRN
jgi:hypothetical protein